jgi:hypothetical protein
LLFSHPAAAQAPQPAAEPTSISVGFHLGRGDAQHFEAARAAGGRFAVVVFSWTDIEPEPGYLYWEVPDAAVRAAEFYGLDLIARLDQPPAWALAESSPTPWKLDAYAAFARRVAERYGPRLTGVILWNEPNLNVEWNGQPPNAAAYAELLKAAYPAVKEVAPGLPVAMAGLASTEGEGDWAINDLDYLANLYAAGVKDYFDVFTAHAYGFGRPPDDAPGKYRPNFRRLELLREIMVANKDEAKPVWVTETGWLTWTDNPKHEWQIVTPDTQASYTLQAITYAQTYYPWIERLGLWQLNAEGDPYGYRLWQGPDSASPAFAALVDTCFTRSSLCHTDPAAIGHQSSAASSQSSIASTQSLSIQPFGADQGQPFDAAQDRPSPLPAFQPSNLPTILSPDVVIRLGDRPQLHPHWVHLYRGGHSLEWQGEFFMSSDQAKQAYDLLIETMQLDQPTNHLRLNGVDLGPLQPRPRLDPTSTWVSQRFAIPDEVLQPGRNRLTVTAGPRNVARQYLAGRWENMQFRNARLVGSSPLPEPSLTGWQPLPSPSGWSEAVRLRPGLDDDLWFIGLQPNQLYNNEQFVISNEQLIINNSPFTIHHSPLRLAFSDILPTPHGDLAATAAGLVWRAGEQTAWQPVEGAPEGMAYTLAQAGKFYAGFEAEGLWQAPALSGPWQRTTLSTTTVTDLVISPETDADAIYAVTGQDILFNSGENGSWEALPLPGLTEAELQEAGEAPGDKLKPRLFIAENGDLVIRHQDRLWVQGDSREWTRFGPETLGGKLYSLLHCCGPGALVGTNKAGLWRLDESGEWTRLDENGFFQTTDLTDLQQVGDTLYAAGDLGLFESADGGRRWQKVKGLPPVISDLVVDPADPARWIAATPAGVYRSQDGGQSWAAISPPWTVWDLAFDGQGRLFLGRSNGLAWSDELGTPTIDWQSSEAMNKVYFLRVVPNPAEPAQVWSGTWGNNIAASSDGGQHVEPIHNGLETLSGLDLLWRPTPGQVTLATFEGLYRTDDGGQSWFKLPGPLGRQTVYSLLQTDDGVTWAGATDGLWRSLDHGATWEQNPSIPPATILRLGQLAVLPQPSILPPFHPSTQPPLVYAPQTWLWAGTENHGLWLSQDNGATWQFAGLAGRTVFNLFFDPLQSRRLIAATDGGIVAVEASVLSTD